MVIDSMDTWEVRIEAFVRGRRVCRRAFPPGSNITVGQDSHCEIHVDALSVHRHMLLRGGTQLDLPPDAVPFVEVAVVTIGGAVHLPLNWRGSSAEQLTFAELCVRHPDLAHVPMHVVSHDFRVIFSAERVVIEGAYRPVGVTLESMRLRIGVLANEHLVESWMPPRGGISIGSAQDVNIEIDPELGIQHHELITEGTLLHMLPTWEFTGDVDVDGTIVRVTPGREGRTFGDQCAEVRGLASPIRLGGERCKVRIPGIKVDQHVSVFLKYELPDTDD
jgi:hypothetical protein